MTDIHKRSIFISDEDKYLITNYSFPKLRYRAHAQKCKALLHSTESLERDGLETCGLQVKDKRN